MKTSNHSRTTKVPLLDLKKLDFRKQILTGSTVSVYLQSIIILITTVVFMASLPHKPLHDGFIITLIFIISIILFLWSDKKSVILAQHNFFTKMNHVKATLLPLGNSELMSTPKKNTQGAIPLAKIKNVLIELGHIDDTGYLTSEAALKYLAGILPPEDQNLIQKIAQMQDFQKEFIDGTSIIFQECDGDWEKALDVIQSESSELAKNILDELGPDTLDI